MSILDLFAKSPFKPMQQHMHTVVKCVDQMAPLFEALFAGDQQELSRIEREIDRIEGEADRLKNDLRAHLPKRLFLPVDRRDLLEILDLQDTIADRAQDVAELLVERPMPAPEAMQPKLRELIEGVGRACAQGRAVVDELDELLELGFHGRQADRVEKMIDELGGLESATDVVETDLIRVLFGLENELSAVDVMLWYQMIGWIGDLADYPEKVGNRIRLLIAR